MTASGGRNVVLQDELDKSTGNPLVRLAREHGALLIVALGLLLRLPLVFLPITYREDIWRQADTASIARNFVLHPDLFYPQINWGGSGPGYVESELQLFPWVVSLLYRVFGEHVWLGRAVSLVLSGVALWLFWRLAERLLDRRPALIALAFFALCPLVLRYSTAFMPEATMLAAYVGGLLLFDRWLEDRRWVTALSCGVVTALAALVKPTALNVLLVFALVLVLRREWRRLVTPQAIVFALIVVVPVAAWLWHGAVLHAEYGNTFGVISGGDSKFGNLAIWLSPRFYLGIAGIDVLWTLAVGALPLAAIGLVVAARRGITLVVAGAIGIVVYYFGVARYAEGALGIQYHLFTTVYAALAVGIGFEWLLTRPDEGRLRRRACRVIAAVCVAVVAVGTVVAEADQFRSWGQESLACGAAMRQVIPAGDLVVITSDDVANDNGTPNNFQNPTLFFHGDRKGWSVAADQDQPEFIDQYRTDGARWLVVNGSTAAQPGPQLSAFLDSHRQVGPGLADGCGIYPLS
jgi:4-amino-4-deoxy-L-arabinose transferase-like glycosyltransferase